jgi:hypothetical protein
MNAIAFQCADRRAPAASIPATGRAYAELYALYWRTLRHNHLAWAARLHDMAHRAARGDVVCAAPARAQLALARGVS